MHNFYLLLVCCVICWCVPVNLPQPWRGRKVYVALSTNQHVSGIVFDWKYHWKYVINMRKLYLSFSRTNYYFRKNSLTLVLSFTWPCLFGLYFSVLPTMIFQPWFFDMHVFRTGIFGLYLCQSYFLSATFFHKLFSRPHFRRRFFRTPSFVKKLITYI